ncbi:hypothetical protein VNO77_14609 [Canavalia gladiata]|uniref:Uncharacterized protein n=1 Tax=Canavalia gladiata TaxID=3824 RepID=A0AAN9QNT1_CANGL
MSPIEDEGSGLSKEFQPRRGPSFSHIKPCKSVQGLAQEKPRICFKRRVHKGSALDYEVKTLSSHLQLQARQGTLLIWSVSRHDQELS